MPTVTNFIVSGLTAYVQENRDLILASFGLPGRGTRGRIGIQTGVKSSARLHYLSLAPVFQDASDCTFNPLDTITLSERTITVAPIKVDGQICNKTLLGKYAEYTVRLNANENDLPFERTIFDALVEQINDKIETLIWQGKTEAHSGSDLIDGFLYLFNNDASVVDVDIAAGSSAFAGISAVYAKMTEETLKRGGLIFVSPAIFRSFMMEMVALNLFHYSGAVNDSPEEFILPGSDVRVVKTYGLAGSLQIVGTFGENLVYGTDMEGDSEDIATGFEEKSKMWWYHVEWASGVGYHFPAQVVLGTFAAAPAVPAPGVTALGQIAENTTPAS